MTARNTAFDAARMAHRWPWKAGAAAIGLTLAGISIDWLTRDGHTAGLIATGATGVLTAGWWFTRTHRMPWRLAGTSTAAAATGVLVAAVNLTPAVPWLVAAGPAGLVACTLWWWFTHVVAAQSTHAWNRRRTHLSDRNGGVATRLDVMQYAGRAALRRQARHLRPSLAGLTRRGLHRLDPWQIGTELARNGWGLLGQSIWVSCEDATARVAGPRSGKTTSLILQALRAPGALIATSTRLDLAEGIHAARTARAAVHFFNPAGIGGVKSTIRWRVLTGCDDFDTACRRADDLIPPGATKDMENWAIKARHLLGILLHAAAVSNRSMSDVRRWADGDPDVFDEVRDILLAIPGGTHLLDEWRAHCGTNDRTRTSISATMAPAVAWVSSKQARDLGDTPAGDPRLLDIRGLITRGETLHLLGAETNTRFAPLIAALTAEIAHTARQLATHRPGGRLDPPLTLILDEAPLVCPVPLDKWTAYMGGHNITIHIAGQSLAQFRDRWGDNGAKTILGNVAALMVFGGSADASDLRDLSTLAGSRLLQLDPDDRRYVPVMDEAAIRAMRPWQVLVFRRHLAPFIGTAPSVVGLKGHQTTTLAVPETLDRVTTQELEAIPTLTEDPR